MEEVVSRVNMLTKDDLYTIYNLLQDHCGHNMHSSDLLDKIQKEIDNYSIRHLRVKKVVQTCGACPSQWDAWTENNEYVYIRFRWGYLSVEMNNEQIYGEQISDGLDGMIDWEDVKKHTGITEV